MRIHWTWLCCRVKLANYSFHDNCSVHRSFTLQIDHNQRTEENVKSCIPRHSGVGSTLPLTETTVSADSPRGVQFASTGARVHCDGLADDETIANELADRLARVGVGDFVDFIGVEPDLALSAANHGGGETLLCTEVDPM